MMMIEEGKGQKRYKIMLIYYIENERIKSFVVKGRDRKYYYPEDAGRFGLQERYKRCETYKTAKEALTALLERTLDKNALLRSQVAKYNVLIKTIRKELNKPEPRPKPVGYKMESYNIESEL